MRNLKTLMLAATAIAVLSPSASAEAPAVLNAPMVAAASVTAPAIEWPVVRGTSGAQTVHIAPGVTEVTAPAAAVEPPPPPVPTLLVEIDLGAQRMTVSENGMQKYSWAISSARSGYRTPTGSFKPTWMAKMWYSRQYGMAPMPHAVFFSGGVAIHATYATGMLGYPASHGCVRLAPKNAATFYSLVNKHGKGLTRIAVHGRPKSGGPAVASKRRNDARRYAQMQNGYGYGYAQGYTPYGYSKPAYVQQYGQKKRRYVQQAPKGYAYGYGGAY